MIARLLSIPTSQSHKLRKPQNASRVNLGILIFLMLVGRGIAQEFPGPQIVDPVRQQAEAAYQRGDYAIVAQLMDEAIERNSEDPFNWYLRASARVELGRQKKSGDLIRSGISDARESLKLRGREFPVLFVPYFFGLTSLSEIENRNEHAEMVEKVLSPLMEELRLKPEEKAQFHYQRGLARMHLNRYEPASEDFESAIKLFPGMLASYLGKIQALSQVGETEAVQKTWELTISKFPREPLVYNERGTFHQRAQRYDEAIADFTRAVELNPRMMVFLVNRGYTLLLMGEYDQAQSDFQQVLERSPRLMMAHRWMASCQVGAGKAEKSLPYYSSALRLEPGSPELLAERGFAHYYLKKYAAAAKDFREAKKGDDKQVVLNPWLFLATARTEGIENAKQLPGEKTGGWVGTIEKLLREEIGIEEALTEAGQTKDHLRECEAHFFYAELLEIKGDTEKAKTHFQEALKHPAPILAAHRGAKYRHRD